ncbi:MAG: TraB/GumN family protein [Defluviitaleaceae bacterium]|nr:TraB/GumN family protein [Defluviitaleaceae bacterium]
MCNLKQFVLLLLLATILSQLAACGRNGTTDYSNDNTTSGDLNVSETTPVPEPIPTTTQPPAPISTSQPSRETIDEIPFLWLVTAPHGQTMYMFGTIHHGTADFYPLPDELMDAFRRSDYLAMEVPLDFTNRDWTVPINLEDYMTEDQRQELRHQAMVIFGEYESYFLEIMDITLDDLYDLDLAMLSGIMSRMAYIKSGALERYGMEHYFFHQVEREAQRGLRRRMRILYIEDYVELDESIRNLSVPFMIRALERTFNTGISAQAEEIRMSMEFWRSGDEQGLLYLLNLELDNLNDDDLAAEWRHVFLTTRDRQMADRASEYMAEGKKVFFMVGAGHLIGEDNVIDLLVQRGYEAIRIR